MTEETGKVKSVLLKDSSIGAGTIALLQKEDLFKGIVTITHINPAGAWVVISPFFSGALEDNMSLHRLVVETSDGAQLSLANKYWNTAAQQNLINTDKEISFSRKPYPFHDGLYMGTCYICECHFQGAKKQPLCPSCCESNTEALFTSKAREKRERAKMVTFEKSREMAHAAFIAARSSRTLIFDEWFNLNY